MSAFALVSFFLEAAFFLTGAFFFGTDFFFFGASASSTGWSATASSSSGAEPLNYEACSSIYCASIRPAKAEVASLDYKLSNSSLAYLSAAAFALA